MALTKNDLYSIAQKRDIDGCSGLNKAQLQKAILTDLNRRSNPTTNSWKRRQLRARRQKVVEA